MKKLPNRNSFGINSVIFLCAMVVRKQGSSLISGDFTTKLGLLPANKCGNARSALIRGEILTISGGKREFPDSVLKASLPPPP